MQKSGRNVLDTAEESLIYDKVLRSGTMAFYRFYLFMADGHIGEAREAHCADDAGAITKAAEFIGLYPALEIWNRSAKVARLSAEELAWAGVIWPAGAVTAARQVWSTGGASNWASVLGHSRPERAGDARALLRMVAFRHLTLIWRLLCWPAVIWPGGEANKKAPAFGRG